MVLMNLITKGNIKKTLIFPVSAGCIRIAYCFEFVTFGQAHIDLQERVWI